MPYERTASDVVKQWLDMLNAGHVKNGKTELTPEQTDLIRMVLTDVDADIFALNKIDVRALVATVEEGIALFNKASCIIARLETAIGVE